MISQIERYLANVTILALLLIVLEGRELPSVKRRHFRSKKTKIHLLQNPPEIRSKFTDQKWTVKASDQRSAIERERDMEMEILTKEE